MALQMIEEGVPYTHPHSPIVESIRAYKAVNWNLSFTHSLREGNMCADWLTKFGSSMDTSLRIWHQCPHEISTTLLADAMGMERLRS